LRAEPVQPKAGASGVVAGLELGRAEASGERVAQLRDQAASA
jgi:hypothetical protein